MSLDHDASVVVGFSIDTEDFLSNFAVIIPRKYHVEARYDYRTGARIDDLEVEDAPERDGYEFKGVVFEAKEDLFTAIEEELNCSIIEQGNFVDGETVVAIESAKKFDRKSIQGIKKVEKDLIRIQNRFKQIKLDLGAPGVYSILIVS